MNSPTVRDRFLAALLRPFAGNDEQRQAARALAEGWMDEANPPDGELDRAAKRFEAMKMRTGRWRRIAVLALGAVALVGLLLPVVRSNPVAKWEYRYNIPHTVRDWFLFHVFQCTDYTLRYSDLLVGKALKDTRSYKSALTRGLNENQSMMLSCDPDFGTDSKQARTLWQEHFPDDPACHYHYLRMYWEEFGHLPEGALETAKRLDPDNGYVPLLAAIDTWETASMNSHDDEQLSRGLRLFHEAAEKPILTGRAREWHGKCAAGFRPTGDASACMARFRWDACNQPDSFGHRMDAAMQHVVPLVLGELATRKDREALDRLAQDMQTMAPKFSRIRGGGQAMTGQSGTLESWAGSLGEAYASLGIEDQAIEIRAPHIFYCGSLDTIIPHEKLRVILIGTSMSGLTELPRLIYEKPSGATSLEPEDLTPGRLADYCDFEWLAIRPVGMILLLLAGAAVLFWRFMSPSSWKLGKHLARSLNAADRAWILGLGLAAPILWYVLATRAPVFRTREIGIWIWDHGIWIPLVQSIAALALILCFLVQTIRWRLAWRLRVIGFGRRSNARGWFVVALAVIALPLTGLPAFVGPDWNPSFASWPVFEGWPPFILALLPAVALLGVSFFWLFLLCITGFVGHPARNPFRAAAGFVFACGCLPAALFLAFAASPMVKAEFQHWLKRDPVLFVDPACDGMTKYEYKLMKLIEQDVRDFWERQNPAPPPTRTRSSAILK